MTAKQNWTKSQDGVIRTTILLKARVTKEELDVLLAKHKSIQEIRETLAGHLNMVVEAEIEDCHENQEGA